MRVTDPSEAKTDAPTEPSPEEVARYLRAHPDFLVEHPDIATTLVPPQRFDGVQVADLQQYMVRNLQDALERAQDNTDQLLTTTRHNLSATKQAHAAVLALLGAQGLEDLIRTVNEDLPRLLNLDVAMVLIETDDMDTVPAYLPTIGAAAVNEIMDGRGVALRDNVSGDERLYGGMAGLVRSDALVRLNLGDGLPRGLFAVGARHVGTFDKGQGTDLVIFLTTVLSHCIKRWLAQST